MPAAAPPASPPAAQQQLVGLLALGLLVGTINGLSRVALPLYVASLGAAAWQVGLVGGLGYGGLLLLSLPMGAWIDRHGSRTLFQLGVALAAALYLLLPWAQAPALAMACIAVLGLVLPFRTVPVYAEFLALLPRLNAAQAGWNRAAQTLGMFFLGPAISGALLAARGFGAVFGLAALGMLAAWWVGRRTLAGLPHTSALPGGPPPATLGQRVAAQWALVRSHAGLRRTMAVDGLTQMAVAYFVVFALVLAVRQFGMSIQAAAGLVTLQGACFVLTLFAGGGWLMRRSEGLRYQLAFALLLGQSLLFGLGTAAWALWLGAALMGVGAGIQSLASVTRFAALMARHGRGRIGGLTSLGGPAGGVLGAVGGGLVSQHLGTAAGFRLLALAFALLALWQGWQGPVADEPGPDQA